MIQIVRNAYVFEKWLSELMTTPGHGPVRPMSKKSRTNIKWLMHQMVDRAMVWGMLEAREKVIAKVKVKSRPGERTRVAGMVTVEEFEQMLLDTTVPVIVRMMIAVAMCTGIRASEILGLRWEVVDLENGFISIEVSSVGKEQDDTKTVSSREDVPMCVELRMILMRWKQQLPAINGWVFANPVTGRPYWRDSMQEYLLKLGKKMEIENLGWHNFRHTYRRMLDDLGTPLEVQMHLLRHASTAMTLKYGKKKGAKLPLLRPANEQLVATLAIPEEIPAMQSAASSSKSGYYGVYPQGGKYAARISVNGYKKYLGIFNSPEDAARRYDEEARKLKGVNAVLNFPHEMQVISAVEEELVGAGS